MPSYKLPEATPSFDVLKSIRTSLGPNVYELSFSHRVSLTFIKFFGCPVCIRDLEKLAVLLPTFVKLNVIPVVCHQESMEVANKFFENNLPANPHFKRIPHASVDRTIQDSFGLRTLSLIQHFDAMPEMMSSIFDGYKFTPPSPRIRFMIEFGLYLVENGRVIKTYEFEHLAARPNYGRYLLSFDPPTLSYVHAIREYFPHIVGLSVAPEKNTKPLPESAIGITIQQILDDTEMRAKFKMFVINEHSVENLLFLEHVEAYKTEEVEERRVERCEDIINNFLKDSSFMEVNVTKDHRTKIHSTFKESGPVVELFDEIVLELKSTVLADSSARFLAKTPRSGHKIK